MQEINLSKDRRVILKDCKAVASYKYGLGNSFNNTFNNNLITQLGYMASFKKQSLYDT